MLSGALSYQIYKYKEVTDGYKQKKATENSNSSEHIELEYEETKEEPKIDEKNNNFKAPKQVKQAEYKSNKSTKVYSGQKIFSGKIIYASRTHSQLSQVVRELRNLPEELLSGVGLNSNGLKISVLGSRKTCKLFWFSNIFYRLC